MASLVTSSNWKTKNHLGVLSTFWKNKHRKRLLNYFSFVCFFLFSYFSYKILFLDVLFPLGVKKVIYVDADQIVRSDLKELWNMDLQGAPYGYTPFCDDYPEMDGFRFWKQGLFSTSHFSFFIFLFLISRLFVAQVFGKIIWWENHIILVHCMLSIYSNSEELLPEINWEELINNFLKIQTHLQTLIKIYQTTCSITLKFSHCLRSGFGVILGVPKILKLVQKQSIL